jgi:holo-[acyl-carrier protein] synthase
MIRAVGLDLVELPRIRKVLNAHPERFLTRHFTDDEVRYCLARRDPVPSLAARFAAKEAFQNKLPAYPTTSIAANVPIVDVELESSESS